MTTLGTNPAVDTLRDPRMQWQRAMHRHAVEQAQTAASAPADEAPAPTFAERMQRVELPGRSTVAAEPADELQPRTLRDRLQRLPVTPVASGVAAASTDPRRAAREAAEQMVSTLFVQPLLDMALEQSGDGPFSPGQGEKTFGPLLNQAMADEIVRKADLPLVDAMVERTLANAPGAVRPSYLKERRDG